jgi:hypothetical protein
MLKFIGFMGEKSNAYRALVGKPEETTRKTQP